jgi:hypothetical protein
MHNSSWHLVLGAGNDTLPTHSLSRDALVILDRIEAVRLYEPEDLLALSRRHALNRLRDIMHELLIIRDAERVD